MATIAAVAVSFAADAGVVKTVTFYGDNVVRVNARIDGKNYDKQGSLTVISKATSPVHTMDAAPFEGKNISVVMDASGALTFRRKDGSVILREKATEIAVKSISGEDTYEVRQVWTLDDDESIYGLGQSVCGKDLDLRERSVWLVQANVPAFVPVLSSSKGWTLLFDTASQSRMTDSRADGMSWWAESSPAGVDYYLCVGRSLDESLKAYFSLTGKAPMFPKKAFGFFMSKERYTSRANLVDIVEHFRADDYPIDFIVQDWQYWKPTDGMWNSAVFDEDRYPDPKGMCDELHDRLHVGLLCSIWPSVGDESELAKELDAKGLRYMQLGHWIPHEKAHVYDAFSKEARDIYFKHMYNGLLSKGVDGLWMDGSELETTGACHDQAGMVRDIKKIGRNAMGDMERYMNAYALMTTKGSYEGQRNVTDKRVITLTRSCWAGQQRYGAMPWAGDTDGSWRRLAEDVAGGLGASLSGIPFWTQDTGGFYTNIPGKDKSKAYQELLARWNQFSIFNPVYRWHGTGFDREPWRFKEFAPEMHDSYIKACRLRYRLLPYIYSLAHKSTSEGYVATRPMVMDFPEEKALRGSIDEFMFGPSLLVSTILRPMYHIEEAGGSTIPEDVFSTPDGGRGVKCTYFKGTDLRERLGEQIERSIDNTWPGPPLVEWPAGMTSGNDFSLRAETVLTIPSAGDYKLYIEGDDGFRMWLDGEKVVEDWNFTSKRGHSVRRRFAAGQKVNVKVEYCNGGGDRILKLTWVPPQELAKEDAEKSSLTNTVRTQLPKACDWYRFRDSKRFAGGTTVEEACPIDAFPLFVRAGSILPFGPEIGYADEKTDKPLELRVYTGADAKFVLYDDDGRTYAYEKGEYEEIPLAWNEAKRTLILGKRRGKGYAGMARKRTFVVTFIGAKGTTKRDVVYDGKAISVTAKK